tara:strand:- start:233 stop:532 length:300 start_codon:yes stop_codon:yes gene_type:complete
MKYHEAFFNTVLFFSYLLYLFAFLQIEHYNPQYLDMLGTVMKYYVTIFLLLRFNPLTKTKFTDFDRRIVFSSAIFMLTTTTISQYARNLGIVSYIQKNI